MQSNVRRAPRHLAVGGKDETSGNHSLSGGGGSSLASASCLSFYHTPPQHECTLPEFEQSAFDRLQVLKHLDNLRARRSIGKGGGEGGVGQRDDDLKPVLQRYRLWGDVERDVLSHHVLRLAYCRSEDTRRWLIAAECLLFRWRFDTETSNDVIAAFLSNNNLNYQPVRSIDTAERSTAASHCTRA